MHRVAVLAATWVLLAPLAHADQGAKRLSVDISLGVRPDMASLGDTITKDGTIDTSDTTMANLVYSTGQAFMGDRNNLAIWHNSNSTDSSFRLMGEAPETGGALLGLEIGVSGRYELDDIIGLPLFVKTGFHYTSRIAGGSQKRVLGDAAQRNPDIAGLLMANGLDPADYIGGVMTNQYSASWFEIPITVGFKVPLGNEATFAYAGAGLSFFRGGFSVEYDVDERYANVLATHIDTEALTVTNLSPGAVSDKVEFTLGGTGINYLLGAQSAIGDTGAVIFLELNGSGAAQTVYSSRLSPEGRRLLTASSSASLYQEDPEWFKRLSFPVVAAGATMRLGLRYYFL
ncbi:porin OmpL1 [Haliangium sp.]|uniref:porin OmpL1 n=1 Tax=Haliangium sp. TaxID=2663208 RepID=UPI003D14B122